MAKIKQKDNGDFKVTMTQEELNAISLLLGYSSDDLVKELAEDNGVKDYSIDRPLTDLYSVFYANRK